jgi:hypothetical protein
MRVLPLILLFFVFGCAGETPEQAQFRQNLGAALRGVQLKPVTVQPISTPTPVRCQSMRNIYGGYDTQCY